MRKVPTWISNLFLFLLVILSFYLQIISPSYFSPVNDLCQDFLSVSSLRHHQPAYQLFSHDQCHIYSKSLPTQYNAHPPTSFLFFYPLAFTTLSTATFYWDVTSVVFFLVSLAVLLSIARLFSFRILFAVFVISTLWVMPHLNYAVRNLSLILLLLTSTAIASFIHKKYLLSGFLIGIATLIKLWPIIFLIPLLKYPKIIWSTFLTLTFGVILTLVLFGFSNFTDYFFVVAPFEKIFTNFPNNNSITSSLTKIFHGVSPSRYPPL